MKKTTMLLICVGMVGLMATSGFAALSTTLSNASFEDELTGGAAYESVQDWQEGGGMLAYFDSGAYDAGRIQTVDTAFNDHNYVPTEVTDGIQMVAIYAPNGPAGTVGKDMFIFQSLGTVVAGDVGFVWSLSADYVVSGKFASLTGNVTAGFSTGTIDADDGVYTGALWGLPGAFLGDVGTLVSTGGVGAYTTTESSGGSWTWQNTGVGTFAPSAGDIGTEIFAIVNLTNASNTGVRFFAAFDNLEMTVIPEPATLFVLGLGGALMFSRRRRA